MNDGMPNALTVIGTAERVETAWWHVASSVRILVVVAMAGSATSATWLPADGRTTAWDGIWWSVCGGSLALAALVDAHERRLPNSLLACAFVASLVPACVRLDAAMTVRALAGGALAGGLLGLVHLLRGVGLGDVKMAGVVGVSVGCFGWRPPLVAIAIAAAAGAGYGAARQRAQVAFGPALWFGWMSALIGRATGWWS